MKARRCVAVKTTANFRRGLSGNDFNVSSPSHPIVIFGGIVGDDPYTFGQTLLRTQMVDKSIQAETPNKVLLASSPQLEPSRTASA